jgi:hypothetical protein
MTIHQNRKNRILPHRRGAPAGAVRTCRAAPNKKSFKNIYLYISRKTTDNGTAIALTAAKQRVCTYQEQSGEPASTLQ